MVDPDHKRYNAPGILLSIGEKNKKIVHHHTGLANIASDTPMNPDGIFRCGLITRLFTMGIVMRLVDQGTFDLDSPLEWVASKHSQDKGLLKIMVSQYPILKPVTVHELLNNTSGLPAFDKTLAYNEIFTSRPKKVWQVENYLDSISGVGVKFQPGYVPRPRGYFSDSATNYFLAGLVIDAVSGIKTSEAMREIFQECGLYHTHYLSYGQMNEEVLRRMIHGYLPVSHPFFQAFLNLPRVTYNNNKELSAIDVTNAYSVNGMGNAAVVSNSSDLIRWFKQLLNAKVVTNNYKKIFKSVPVKSFTGGSKDEYCFGFYKTLSKAYGEILWSAGNSLGYEVLLAHSLERDLTFVLLANVSREHINLHCEGMVSDVLEDLLG